MDERDAVSRRHFMGGAVAALGSLGLAPAERTWARDLGLLDPTPRDIEAALVETPHDQLAHLSSNENPAGPSLSVMDAMNSAWKHSMRYGYPDGDVRRAIADHHGVGTENVLLGAGSSEILSVVGASLLAPGKKVIGVEPSYGSVYTHATGIRADAVTLPLLANHRQDVGMLIDATNKHHGHHRSVGFVYLCNPDNPTGVTVSANEVGQLLAGVPEDVPVLIDEAYHHFVEDPLYESSVPRVLEGRQVIIVRTFSKIYGMAAMRFGYAIAPPDLIERMRPWRTGSVNALVKWGAVAALKDKAAEQRVRERTIALRNRTTAEVERMGHQVIPSNTNFFMVHTGRPAPEVQSAFRARGVVVGRPFPPMLDYLRVSIGTEKEMDRFLTSFQDIFGPRA